MAPLLIFELVRNFGREDAVRLLAYRLFFDKSGR